MGNKYYSYAKLYFLVLGVRSRVACRNLRMSRLDCVGLSARVWSRSGGISWRGYFSQG